MRSRRRFSKRLLVPALLISILLALYLHYGLFPARLKDRVIREVETATGLKISFTKVLVLPFRGVILHDLVVRGRSRDLIFFSRKFSVDVRLLPFFRENKIIIRNILLDSPVYAVNLDPEKTPPPAPPPKTRISGQIDVPVVPEKTPVNPAMAIEDGPEAFLPENVYLESVRIVDGTLLLKKTPGSPALETIHSIHILMNYDKPPRVTFSGSASVGEKTYAAAHLDGFWDLEKEIYEFRLRIQSDKVPEWLSAAQQKNLIRLEKGALSIDARLAGTGGGKTAFGAAAKLGRSELRAGKSRLVGEALLKANGFFDPETKQFSGYRGALEFLGIDAYDLAPELPRLNGIRGKILFDPGGLKIDAVRGECRRLPFTVDGQVRSLETLDANLRIGARAELQKFLSLLSVQQARFLKDLQIRGRCLAVTSLTGSLKNPSGLRKEHLVELRDASLEHLPTKTAVHNIGASIFAGDNGLRIEGARFDCFKKSFRLAGFLPQKPETPGRLILQSSDGLELSAEYSIKGDLVRIAGARLRYLGILCDLRGEISNLKNPLLALRGHADADLKNAPLWIPSRAAVVRKAGLGGRAAADFTLRGTWNKPREWKLDADLGARPLFAAGTLRLDDALVQIRAKQGVVHIPYFHAKPYGGILGGSLVVDTTNAGNPFDLKIHANHVDLARLTGDLRSGPKNFGGTLLFQAVLNGAFARPSGWHGQGAVSVQNGKLWETSLFKQMGNLVLLKVEGLDQVVFHAMAATFLIQDGRIWTQDMTLNSDTVDLSLKGSVGFNQKLDLLMGIQYSRGVLRGAMNTGGIAPLLVDAAGSFISKYKISGTLKNPSYAKT
ncbi:MAG: hypothetical protein HYT89_00015 [Candidatus Omnitrophica bacterium]|nr:hypothetical protein [Candidatus Omnitrophota bacterium]